MTHVVFKNFALTRRAILGALILVGSAAVLLAALYGFIGPHTAQAGYLAIMFLLSPSRALLPRWRAMAALWAVIVAMLGFTLGSLGTFPVLVALVGVCLVQGLFRIGDISSMTRSPVNLIVFASLSHTDVQFWQVLLGSSLGAAFMLAFATLMPTKHDSLPTPSPVRERLGYGVMLAVGSLGIVAIGEAVDFPYVSWTLLSYCMILAVGVDNRTSRARDRVVGTAIGAVFATLVSLLPAPVPILVALVCTLLCVAYILSGNYPMFVTLLTPVVLLTTSSDQPAHLVGLGRIESVAIAAVLALVVNVIAHTILHDRHARIVPRPQASTLNP
ncbi:FUSC family protein [Mycetocola saprophilus]|uniref:FUSC family protein n=1 Tax=Mycetocola saprophilus TaxID=76636 RepID=UPI00068C1121|nr:FUSC family protein [Mycetocola saprophilus]